MASLICLLLTLCMACQAARLDVAGSFIYHKPKGDWAARATAYDAYARTFTVDGVSLQGWLVERPGKPLRVFYGGNSIHAAAFLPEAAANADFATLALNYRGYGKSEGKPSEKALVGDALAVLDQVLTETERPVETVILIGESLGSGVAVQVAAQRKVGKLLLLVPYDNLLSVAKGHVPYLPMGALMADRFASDEAAKVVTCPVVIFAAQQDEVIPVKHARRLRDCFKKEQVTYFEYPCRHNDLYRMSAFPADFKKNCQLSSN